MERQKNQMEARKLKAQTMFLKQQYGVFNYLDKVCKRVVFKCTPLWEEKNEVLDENAFLKMRTIIYDMKELTTRQLIEVAKDYFRSLHLKDEEKLMNTLTPEELIIFIISLLGYAESQLSMLLDIKFDQFDLEYRKEKIKVRLTNAGMAEAEIDRVLYP